MTSTARSDPSASTMPPGGQRSHGARDELDVVLLERGIEGAREDRPLARIRVPRRDGLAQVRPVGELALDVVEAELPARFVRLGAGPVQAPAPQAPLQQVPLAPALPAPAPGMAERRPLPVGEVVLALGHDPTGFALEHVELLHDRLDRGDDLRGRRAGTDDGDDLAAQVVLVLPARGVKLRSLEVVEPGPLRVAGHVEKADGAHQHVALLDGRVVELQHPEVAVVVPRGGLHRDAEPQVRTKAELVDRVLEILLELRLPRVRAAPVVRLEREAIEVRPDVDFGARVGVVPPRAADPERRLADRERVDAGLLQLHARGDAAEPGSHHYDARCHRALTRRARSRSRDLGMRTRTHTRRVDLRLVDPDRRAVHEHVAHAGGLLGGEPLGVGREVAHAPRRAGADGGRIEHAHVGRSSPRADNRAARSRTCRPARR